MVVIVVLRHKECKKKPLELIGRHDVLTLALSHSNERDIEGMLSLSSQPRASLHENQRTDDCVGKSRATQQHKF
jgi:hypothetical protein